MKTVCQCLPISWCELLIIIFLYSSFPIVSTGQQRVEVKSIEGTPSLFINGKQYPPFAYMSYFGEEEYYKEIAETGVHLYCFPAYLGDRGINTMSGIGPFRRAVWTGPDKYDFSSIKTDFEKIIKADPDAKIIIRLHLDPPEWWEKLNPDACCQLPDGTTFRQCFFSEEWKNETGNVLKYLVEWLLDSTYSKYLAGIHVAAGGTEEWVYHYNRYFYDENPVRQNAFRAWLKHQYKNDTISLQEAWQNPAINFQKATLADISGNQEKREWRDQEKEQNYIDTYRFHAETLANDIAYFCKVVKDASRRRLLTGAFYGYHYFITDARKGHGALGKLLECPDLDYISSPNAYNRVIGEDWPPMAAIQSVQLHGKLWLAENDTRTSITTLLKDRAPGVAPPGQYESGVWLGPDDMETSVSFLWKNAGRMLTQGYGGWWFDMWGGWFSDPRLLNVIKKTNEFYTSYPKGKGEMMQPQVCVMVDEQLCFWDATYGALTNKILVNRYSLAKTGAPYELFFRTDQKNLSTNQYKIIWLMGFLELNNEEEHRIKEWQQQGITVIWTDGKGTHILKRDQDNYIRNVFLLTDSQLRDIFENAGVHIYIHSGDVFYIGRNWLCLHSTFGGNKVINLPCPSHVIDPQTGKTISDSTCVFDVKMEPKSTIILRLN
jgi:beta-galactosidase